MSCKYFLFLFFFFFLPEICDLEKKKKKGEEGEDTITTRFEVADWIPSNEQAVLTSLITWPAI